MNTVAVKNLSSQRLLFIAGLAWLFDAMDVGIVSFIITALKEDWGLTAQQLGWIGSINSIGMAVGALLAGLLADRIGRKSVFIYTLLLFSIASGLSAFTTTFIIFVILRFFIGVGLGGELPIASTLVSESVPAKERGRIVVLLESFWAGGWLLAAIIAYFVIPSYGWQVALLIGAAPALYTVYLRMGLPDSSAFQRNRSEDKPSVLQNILTVWSGKYVRQTIMLWLLWFCVVFSYYGMFLWLPTVMVLKGFTLIKSFEYVLIMTIAQLPGYFSAAWLIEKVGRKFVLVTYLVMTAVSAYFFGSADTLIVLMTAGIFMSFFNLGAWGALYAYTPEQYPTKVRATGVGMAAFIGRVGGVLGPLLLGYLVAAEMTFTVIFSIFCIVTLIGAFTVLILGKETRGQELISDV
ncbi:MFS transporter [Desulfolucanica intricata]|uniref:MFS transporter n=1 Tax=Desulfolucanica intricata TaxID=1285191 RepID=UPI000831F251|nr:MFS transporter [Desulfolucanica intricata]